MNAGNFYLEYAAEKDKQAVLQTIRHTMRPGQRIFIGVTDVFDPKIESPEEIRDLILEAAEVIPVEQFGTTDDCGFSPFADDLSTSRETAFAKIKARIEGTLLAENKLSKSHKHYNMRTLLLITGILLLIAIEILRVYFIMPFPGSQKNNSIDFAYWLHNNIFWLRLLGLVMVAWPVIHLARHGKTWKKVTTAGTLIFYGVVFYFFNYKFLADKMFYQPSTKTFLSAEKNAIPVEKLVLGVWLNGEAKAYPIQLIGYHHQVRDTVGNTPVMVTYCTVCRTGRVFSPLVDNKDENFRLVGMDHFNAMFEDATTKSWWRQVTGEAVAGPLKGKSLHEIPAQQVTLSSWLQQYPNSLVMQPDTLFKKQYEDLADFDKGTIKNGLEKRDSASWQFKSWVLGIDNGKHSKAYDWNELVEKKIINDSLPDLPVVIVLESDTASFHVYKRSINGLSLHLETDSTGALLKDANTQTLWNINGVCIDGPLKGQQLLKVKASQEFWHSWQTFHPVTERRNYK